MTNLDVIRTLPAESLARCLDSDFRCQIMRDLDRCDKFEECQPCVVDWLNSETTEKDLKEILKEVDE